MDASQVAWSLECLSGWTTKNVSDSNDTRESKFLSCHQLHRDNQADELAESQIRVASPTHERKKIIPLYIKKKENREEISEILFFRVSLR